MYTKYLTNTVFESNIDGVIVALGGKTSDVGDTMLTGKVASTEFNSTIVMFLFVCIMNLLIIPATPTLNSRN